MYYHVVMRGNNRAAVYNDHDDKYHLMRCIGEAHHQFRFTISAFCIMSNHFHLLIRSEDDLGKIMARINRRYSDYYSKRYRHIGRIYQRRYYAKMIDDPKVLLIVSRYIHRNPIETRIPMVKQLCSYTHSSYPNYNNTSDSILPFLETEFLPTLLPLRYMKNLKGYCEYCLKELETNEKSIDEWMLEMGVED